MTERVDSEVRRRMQAIGPSIGQLFGDRMHWFWRFTKEGVRSVRRSFIIRRPKMKNGVWSGVWQLIVECSSTKFRKHSFGQSIDWSFGDRMHWSWQTQKLSDQSVCDQSINRRLINRRQQPQLAVRRCQKLGMEAPCLFSMERLVQPHKRDLGEWVLVTQWP